MSSPVESTAFAYKTSRKVTAAIVEVILKQHSPGSVTSTSLDNALMKQQEATTIERRLKAALQKETSDELLRRLPPSKRRSVELAREAGASAWLSARPIEEHWFCAT